MPQGKPYPDDPQWVKNYYEDFGTLPKGYRKEKLGIEKTESDLLSKNLANKKKLIESQLTAKDTAEFEVKDPLTGKPLPDKLKFRKGSKELSTYLQRVGKGEFITEPEKIELKKKKDKPKTESQKIEAENKKRKNLLGKAQRAQLNFEDLDEDDPKRRGLKRIADDTKFELDKFDFRQQYPDARNAINKLIDGGYNKSTIRFIVRERYGFDSIEEFNKITK